MANRSRLTHSEKVVLGLRSFGAGCIVAGVLFTSSLLFEHRATIRSNGETVRDRPAFYAYVQRWVVFPGFMAGALIPLLLEAGRLMPKRYTDREFVSRLEAFKASESTITEVMAVQEMEKDDA